MAKHPTQQTEHGATLPIPKRRDVLAALKKAAKPKPEKPPEPPEERAWRVYREVRG